MPDSWIRLRGARTHNLKNIDLDLPVGKLIALTGLSGSGKSSLAFDTIFAEGQRRYVESLSAYARQFLTLTDKPDIDTIEGLSPAISIDQKTSSHNPRSTVGTVTEINDYLRLLFARLGRPRCPDHGLELDAMTISQMVDDVLKTSEGRRVMLLSPLVRERKGEYQQLFDGLRSKGFVRMRIDGKILNLDEVPELKRQQRHTVEVVIDRLRVSEEQRKRVADSLETALSLNEGLVVLASMDGEFADKLYSAKFACPECGYALTAMEPRLFSFNSPTGACPGCDGLGVRDYFDESNVIDAKLSLAEGAVGGWNAESHYYFSLMSSLAQHYHFSLHTPFTELSPEVRNVILNGSGGEKIRIDYRVGRRSSSSRRVFPGVLAMLQQQWNETQSNERRERLGRFVSTQKCPECNGARLNREARHVFVCGHTLAEMLELPIDEALKFFSELKFAGQHQEIGERILREVLSRLQFLNNVGLSYLNLARGAHTLSGGESQRIRLASQIGSGLVGVLYVLDEPTIGLHQRDNQRLLSTLKHLRGLGNTVIVVEHDQETIRAADHIVDIGPGAGRDGGHVVAEGDIQAIMGQKNSLTGQYLAGTRSIERPGARKRPDGRSIRITGASGNNLQQLDVEIPAGLLTCVTGVSGSGKSTLVKATLYNFLARGAGGVRPAPHRSIEGAALFDKVIDINQGPIGRTPRSNPATYTGLFSPVRELFAATREARIRNYRVGRFSFNVRGGRCEACQGDGLVKVEMHFMPDLYVPCDQCRGMRYNRETLEVQYKGRNIHEVLSMSVAEALEFFGAHPQIKRKLETLNDVGLSYISLGQNATTLSGGEAQRIKLSRELSRRDTGRTLYILDEPTTGLHFHDITQLLKVLFRLRDCGNTVIVIEHNLDVIKTADWVIDLGPEGGSRGGCLVASGPPEIVAANKESFTGNFLAPYFGDRRVAS